MAYVFDNIDQALNGGQSQTPAQSNIFDSGQMTNTTPQTGGGQQSTSSDVKTDTGADIGDSKNDASATSNSGGAQPQESSSGQNANAAVAKNTQSFTGLPSQYQQSADKISSDLQNEANSYLSTQGAKGSADNVDDATLASAAGGDQTAGGKVTSRLSETAPVVDNYESAVNTAIPQLDDLNSQAGLAGVVAQNQNENYTGGLANLDAMLMGQNKDFIAARQGLNQTQAGINQTQVNNNANLTTQAQAAAQSNFDAGTGQIKTYLTAQEQALDQAAAAKQAAYNAHQAAIAKSDPTYIKAQQAAALKALAAHDQSQPYAQYLAKATVDPSKYYQAAGAVSDPNQFYTQDSANKFANLEALLGGNQVRLAGGALPASETFNAGGYQQALTKAAQTQYAQAQAAEAAKQQAAAAALAEQQRLAAMVPPNPAEASNGPPTGSAGNPSPAITNRGVGNIVKTFKRITGAGG